MTDTLTKALSILTAQAANPIALEALVASMEAHLEGKQYDGSGGSLKAAVEAPVQPKHILEDYQITEKDVGSLVLVSDSGDGRIRELGKIDANSNEYPFEDTSGFGWKHAKPHLDPIKLHFRPFYATSDSVAPDDLGEHIMILWSDGCECYYPRRDLLKADWQRCDRYDRYVIGYRPLQFVNPLKTQS